MKTGLAARLSNSPLNRGGLTRNGAPVGGVHACMMNRRWYLLWMVGLALAYIAVAAINRWYAWGWGREWLAPTMMLAVLTSILAGACRSPGARARR